MGHKMRRALGAAGLAAVLAVAAFVYAGPAAVRYSQAAELSGPYVSAVPTGQISLNTWNTVASFTADADVWAQSSATLAIHNGAVGDRVAIRANIGGALTYLGDAVMGNTQWTVNAATRQYPLDDGQVMAYQVRVTRSGSGMVTVQGGQAWWSTVPRAITPPPTTAAPTTAGPPPTTPVPTTPPPTTGPPSPDPNVWPNPATTGAPITVDLPVDSRCALNNDNEVIDAKHLTCTQRIAVNATGVSITNSVIDTALNNYSGGQGHTLAVTDSTIGHPGAGCGQGQEDFALGAEGLSLLRVEVYGTDGLRFSQVGPGTMSVRESYIAACSTLASLAHSDGLQGDGTTGGHTIIGNTFDMSAAESSTAAVGWLDFAAGPATVTGNLFYGYRNYGTFLSNTDPDTADKHVVDGNRFSPHASGITAHNRNDENQCARINWGADNRLATVDGNWNVSAGAAIPCNS
jgi:hypothetical protein